MGITIITCSGISNTGKLTTQTGTALLRRHAYAIEAAIPATRPTAAIKSALQHAEEILVLDGCGDCCGHKKLRALGIEPHLHLIATECGIKKNGMSDPGFAEIERLTAAVLEAVRR